MYAGLFSEWSSFYSDSTPIPYYVRIYPLDVLYVCDVIIKINVRYVIINRFLRYIQ